MPAAMRVSARTIALLHIHHNPGGVSVGNDIRPLCGLAPFSLCSGGLVVDRYAGGGEGFVALDTCGAFAAMLLATFIT